MEEADENGENTLESFFGIKEEDFTNKTDLGMVMGDYDRLRQMFMIIFDNAIKFSPEDSTVSVSVTPSTQTELTQVSRPDIQTAYSTHFSNASLLG